MNQGQQGTGARKAIFVSCAVLIVGNLLLAIFFLFPEEETESSPGGPPDDSESGIVTTTSGTNVTAVQREQTDKAHAVPIGAIPDDAPPDIELTIQSNRAATDDVLEETLGTSPSDAPPRSSPGR